jgi:hypothetical protein
MPLQTEALRIKRHGRSSRRRIFRRGDNVVRELELSRPVDAYKAIIDELVSETSHGVSEKLVVQEDIFSRAPDAAVFNTFIQSLSAQQRELLARMLHSERNSSIHDVLAVLSWWVSTQEVGFTFRGNAMPVDLSGAGLHGDFVGRQNDWEWPKED